MEPGDEPCGMLMPGTEADWVPGDGDPGDDGEPPGDELLLGDELLGEELLGEELLDGEDGLLAEGCWLWFCCMVLQPDKARSADIARIGAHRLNIGPIAASIDSPGLIFSKPC